MQSEPTAPVNFAIQSKQQNNLHVAIIMDGNGRWASRRGLPRVAGHHAGVAAVRRTVEHAPTLGITSLTLYAFSSDNWRRPEQEVRSIFWLLRAYLRLEAEKMKQQGVRLEAIGRRDRLPRPLLREIERAERATCKGERLRLRVAIDYSSRNAIARAATELSQMALMHTPSADQISQMFAQALTAEAGEVDLLIRTGGEKRLSDFLLWESAYAELVFTDRMWPDFDAGDLEAAVSDFRSRNRRFGGLTAVPEPPAASLGGAR